VEKIKVLQRICFLSMIFIVGGMNAETVSFHNTKKSIKISFSGIKGKTDTGLKIVYANSKTAYLVPLDTNKKKFSELKYYKLSNNTLDAIYYSDVSGAVTYSYSLDKKNNNIKVTASSYDCYLQLRLKADAIIIPDHVTDDELFWPQSSSKRIRIPGDNHLFIELLNSGNSMLTCLWNYADQEVVVSRNKSKNSFYKATFTCTPGNHIWFSFLNKKNIWYKSKGKLPVEYVSVNWAPPIPAMWHMVLRREKGRLPIEDNLGEMWVLLTRDKKYPKMYIGMGLCKPKKMQAWAAGMGWINYPCFIEKGKTRLSLPVFKDRRMKRVSYTADAAVVYPFSKFKNTPENILLPLGAVREILGENCVERLYMRKGKRNGFPATCGVTGKLEKIFYRGDAEVKKKQDYIKKEIERMDIFVYAINAQLKENIKFAKELQDWLKKEKKLFPELTTQADKYIKELEEVEKYYIIKKEKIKTPAYYMTLSEKLGKLVSAKLDDEEKENRCKALGRKVRQIGGSQDNVSGQQRMYFKAIKQQLSLALTKAKKKVEIEFLKHFSQKLHNKLKIRGMMEGK
jgi:hypothetical protein